MNRIFKIAIRNLMRYKRRTLLTSLLITLGVLMVILFSGLSGSFKTMMIGQITDANLSQIQIHKKGYVSSMNSIPLNLNLNRKEYAKIEDKNTNPGYVILKKQPNVKQYKKAVKDIVLLDEIKSLLNFSEALYEGYKNGRGLIGATSAIAWSSSPDKTYEFVAFRQKKQWGTRRDVDDKSVNKMDKIYTTTFRS